MDKLMINTSERWTNHPILFILYSISVDRGYLGKVVFRRRISGGEDDTSGRGPRRDRCAAETSENVGMRAVDRRRGGRMSAIARLRGRRFAEPHRLVFGYGHYPVGI